MFKFIMMMLSVSMMFVDGGTAGGGAGGSEGGEAPSTEGGEAPSTEGGEAPSTESMILGKFKDQGALEEGYSALEKKLGSFQGTPKDGYAPIEGIGETSADQNRLMAVIQEVGKDAQMDQGTYESLYTQITEMQTRVEGERLAETIKSIPNYDTRAKAMSDTALRFLRPDQAEAVDALMQSKESFEAIEIVMGQLRGGSLPQAPGQAEGISDEALRKQINGLKPSDTNERTRLLKILNERSGGEGSLV